MGRPTIDDVAEKSGFSKATVSAVLNDADTVSDSTRRKVEQVIDELNYRPRSAARGGFRDDGNRSVGVIIKEGGNSYYADILSGARSCARQKGYTILSASSGGEYASEQQIVDVMKGKDVDGLIVVPVLNSDTDLSYLFDLKRRNFPFVLLETIRGIRANLVDVDNEAAAKMGTSYLIEKGHRQIIHFAGPEYSMHSEERTRGMREAFSESSLAFHDDLVIPAGARLEDGYETGEAFFGDLSSEERPTGVVCYNDLVAIGLIRALRELGIAVPEDVSVIGCDDIEPAKYVSVPLTTIQIPKREMGRHAAEILIKDIESSQKTAPSQVHLEAEIIERAVESLLLCKSAGEIEKAIAFCQVGNET
ncbi:DNA-binding LacI/PurR family transcriptional regulator [Salinibacter ruber]|uniref:LacI family DNA-binding transcriptional regulator n=1 Tax=Salinibacter ruber TaxID=146919 RepID=UPI00216A827D|nr:LacI family DNA-binding transcriptional regulator [Salinibacter ruber]MCS3658452.1 DNA-binding LacI/PurR family transcriptional regulator [Salinibacter ruber]